MFSHQQGKEHDHISFISVTSQVLPFKAEVSKKPRGERGKTIVNRMMEKKKSASFLKAQDVAE